MFMFNARPLVLAGGLVLATALPVEAQTLATAGGNRLDVALSASAAYDTNVARTGASLAAAQGLRQEDEIFSPAVVLDIQEPVGRGAGFVQGTAAYNFYARNTVLDRESIDLKGGLEQKVSRCDGTLSADYFRGLNQLANVTAQQITDTFSQARLSLDARCGRPIGLAPVFSVTETWTTNSEQILSRANSQGTNATAGLSYQSPTNGVLSASGVYQRTTYPDPGVSGLPFNTGFELVGANLKYVRMLGARIQGTLSGTYTIVSSAGAPDFRGFTYEADLSYRASSRLGFDTSLIRRVVPSNLVGASYQIENDYSANATYQLSPRLSLELGGLQQVGDQEGSTVQLDALLLRHYDLRSVFGTLTLTLNRMSLALDLRNTDRTTNQSALNYSDIRASITARAHF